MIEDALEIATDPDYKFDLAIQLGRLEIAKEAEAERSQIDDQQEE
jgi:coatomer subunit beta'